MALDEPTNDDTVIEHNSLTFCISNDLLTTVKAVTIDTNYMGFDIISEVPINADGGGCGSCGSGGCS